MKSPAHRFTLRFLLWIFVAMVAPFPSVPCDRGLPSPLDVTTVQAADDPAAPVQLWTCGMHPQVIQDHPGECPICHMKLTPLESAATEASSAGSAVTIDPVVVQNMGVRTVRAVEGPVVRELRVAGFVEEAEPGIHDVTLRVGGFIRHLYANTEGLHIASGDPMFDLYSPDIQVAVDEMIALRKRRDAARASARGDSDATMDSLWNAALRKLALQGLDPTEIARLQKLDHAPDAVTFRSPLAGEITEKPVVEGAAVTMGQKVLRIVDHSTLWIDARVFEQDLAVVSVGQSVQASIASQPGRTFAGQVVFIHPHLDPTTRTASVRMAVSNAALELRPGMFADVVLRAKLADSAVLVPREAVIDTGDRQVAFVVGEKPGHFEPRRVRIGWPAEGGNVQVLEGLAAGDEVVVSGQFLIDAESRLQDALRKFISQRQVAGVPPADAKPGTPARDSTGTASNGTSPGGEASPGSGPSPAGGASPDSGASK
ncbi:MAG TPA: efflux RND transporter periplasmic adaptor subunit [Candidatus Binatia bacterium]|jgi:Cu(I)/Ag(I) efflux system membrane fusion protein